MLKPKCYFYLYRAVKMLSNAKKISILSAFDYFIDNAHSEKSRKEFIQCKSYFQFKTAGK